MQVGNGQVGSAASEVGFAVPGAQAPRPSPCGVAMQGTSMQRGHVGAEHAAWPCSPYAACMARRCASRRGRRRGSPHACSPLGAPLQMMRKSRPPARARAKRLPQACETARDVWGAAL